MARAVTSAPVHRRATLLIAATALIGGLSACDTTEPYAAKVNGEVISMADFRDDVEVLAAGFAEQDPTATDGASVNGDLARGYLSTQILLQLIEAEVAVREIDLDALSQAQNDEASQLIGSIAVGSTAELPTDMQARFERQARAFVALQDNLTEIDPDLLADAVEASVVGLRCVSHILVETQGEADDVMARLDDGEEFAALAQELSLDPGSGANGGALDTPDRCTSDAELDQFVPEFAAASRAAEFGVPTAPVQSQFGFHIILVSEPAPETIEARRAEAEQTVGQELAGSEFQDFVNTALDTADVSVASELGIWDPTQGVLAPGSTPAPALDEVVEDPAG